MKAKSKALKAPKASTPLLVSALIGAVDMGSDGMSAAFELRAAAELMLAAYQARVVDLVTMPDFADIIENLADPGVVLFDDLVKAELERRGWDPQEGDQVGMNEVVVTQELAFQIGVAVGRKLR